MPKKKSDFWKNISDPEIKILSKLLSERLASVWEAMDKSNTLAELKDHMKDDIVNFMYSKASGEDRPAFGTRCPDIIRRYNADPSGEHRDGPLTTFTYFDLTRRSWRSFRPENIIRIEDNYTI